MAWGNPGYPQSGGVTIIPLPNGDLEFFGPDGTSLGTITPGGGGGGVPATTVTGPDAYGDPAAVGTGTKYAREDHDHGLIGAPAIPSPATTVTGPDAYGDPADAGTSPNYALEDHDHGLPAAPTPPPVASPLIGGTVAGGVGGTVAFEDAPGSGVGGDAVLTGGTDVATDLGGTITAKGGPNAGASGGDASIEGGYSTLGNSAGGNVIAHGSHGSGGHAGDAEMNGGTDSTGKTGGQVYVYGGVNDGHKGAVAIWTDGLSGVAAQFLGSDGNGRLAWLAPLVRNAVGAPSGAPGVGELPFAVDTTATPGTLYFWDGSAWGQLI